MKYKIIDIKQRSKEVSENVFEQVIKVWYETETGYKGSIKLSKKGFTADKVRKTIEKELEEIEMLGLGKEVFG